MRPDLRTHRTVEVGNENTTTVWNVPFHFCTIIIHINIIVFSLYEEYLCCFLVQMMFFYFVTKGWIFDISICENLINQSIT